MPDAEDITILCPLCAGSIFYPSDREGEEVPCPHCEELIYLLSHDLPDQAPAVEDLRPATVVVRPQETGNIPTPPQPPVPPGATLIHATTEQKVHSDAKRKAVIKKATHNPSATPPNRKKICPPESNVLKIPHLFPPIALDREGTKFSPELILSHPVEFTLDRTGGGLRKKAEVWQCRWTAIHMQSDRHAKPWVTLQLKASRANPGTSNGLQLKAGNKLFELATDAAWERARQADTQNAQASEIEASNLIVERYSFEHDDFRYLCGEIALNDTIELSIDGISEAIDDDTCAEFREYTLEFFEALRREFPIFFR